LPKLFVERFTEDTIEQFRVAAKMRYDEGWKLALSGHRTAAIYLWGYAAEVTLKTAWFSLIGFPERKGITRNDLRGAVSIATSYGIPWPGGAFHNLFAWAQLLARHRISLGRRYPGARFENDMLARSQRIHDRWRETMRYKKNVVYAHETQAVADSTNWLLANRDRL
jgi:hypothetical protein